MLNVDFSNVTSPKLENGITTEELDNLNPRLKEIKEKFNISRQNIGFTKLPYAFDSLQKELEQVRKLAEGLDTIVVIGIGGSDLGARAIFKALKHHFYNQVAEANQKKLYFTGDTTDPDEISNVIDILDLSKTLFLIVSKSGNTVEQSSIFVYLRHLVLKQLGATSDLKHFVFLTDPETGTLHELAKEKGYKTVAIPSDVGGRFSVLSSVGMVPAALLDLNVEEFLNGAKDLDLQLGTVQADEDLVLQYAAIQYLYYKKGKNISVLMPYQYSLSEFSRWFRQLWAESLGKRLDVEGSEVFEGITPVAALGPTDQHSQLQLYNEGPNDKLFTFIVAEKARNDLKISAELHTNSNLLGTSSEGNFFDVRNSNSGVIESENYDDIKAFDFLRGRNFHEILNLEQQTTAFALTKNQRPNMTITIPKVDEYHLGQLFYFFEVAVTYLGFLLNINPFDQPGVELSKNAMYGVLGKPGFENEKKEFEEFRNT